MIIRDLLKENNITLSRKGEEELKKSDLAYQIYEKQRRNQD